MLYQSSIHYTGGKLVLAVNTCRVKRSSIIIRSLKKKKSFNPRAGGAKRRARVLIPPGYLHPGKRKH